VLHAPARRGGIQRASKTKINNLGTNEYASNLPFSKNHLVGVISQSTFWQERWIQKKMKPGILKKSFKFRNSCEKTFFQII
jgi:hypothetical protein